MEAKILNKFKGYATVINFAHQDQALQIVGVVEDIDFEEDTITVEHDVGYVIIENSEITSIAYITE